ncbi:MAG: EAL domain-containing protein [Chromatiaceae bacterium]
MALQIGFLRSKVAVRVFMLFILSALVPVTALTLVFYQAFSERYAQELESRLRRSSEDYGNALFDRMRRIDSLLGTLAHNARDLDRLAPFVLKLGDSPFQGFALVPPDGGRPRVFGTAGALPAPLKSLQSAPRPDSQGRTRLQVVVDQKGVASILVAQPLSQHPEASLVGLLDPNYLWGRADELDQRISLCVLGPRDARLFCSDSTLDPYLARGHRADAEANGVAVRAWGLFLATRFDAGGSWQILSGAPRSELLAGLSAFKGVFLRVVGFTLALVGLLSVHQIRHSFLPLEALMQGIQRLAHQDFEHPVVVTARDEFGRLAKAFNDMAERLRRQFRRLTALALIDRGILTHKSRAEIVGDVLREAGAVSGCAFAALALADQFEPERLTRFLRFADPPLQREPHRLWFRPGPAEQELIAQHPVISVARGEDAFRALFPDYEGLREAHLRLAPIVAEGRLSALLVIGSRGEEVGDGDVVWVVRELADRVAVALSNAAWEEQLEYLAYHDPLTRLPNRLLLSDRLDQAVAQADRTGTDLAVIFLDLDRFKIVNDSLGHGAGDALLVHLAHTLSPAIRAGDTLARLAGDEFVVLATNLKRGAGKGAEAAAIAGALMTAMATPFVQKGHELRASASLGIALYPEDGTDAETLLRNADAAMYHAKSRAKGGYQFYSKELNSQTLRRLEIEAELHRALEHNELILHFQPKIDTRRRTVRGVEALVRWQHPSKGLVPPGEFIPVAEETGLIVSIGGWVLNEACRRIQDLSSYGCEPIGVAVNISPRQFREVSLVDQVRSTLEDTGLPPELLEVEITEESAMEDTGRALRVLESLKELGTRIGIDDFGVGYSSLGYLKHFPIDTVKIDRSFIRNVDSDSKDAAVVSGIIVLARSLGATVVAEGVETEAHYQLLRAKECDEIQGFYFSPPLPFDALVELIRQTPLPRSPLGPRLRRV